MPRSLFQFVFLLSFLFASQIGFARNLPDFTDIVADNSPAVVKITVVSHAMADGGEQYHSLNDPRIPRIFRDLFEQQQRRQQAQPKEQQSLGSGFIISDDGYILTNNHVIDGADEITVIMQDRREFEAKLVGADMRSDLALLKVESDDALPIVKFGKPRELMVGEWVLAIGSPFGLDYSVSAGIVSAKGRSLPSEEAGNYVPFIQTDVAINPGNSGGPLFNMKGEVVGINSQIYTRSGGSIGLSFAIPIEVALNVVEQLKDSGVVTRGWLGVIIQDVDKDLAEAYGLEKPRGALITQLDPDGPAASSGVEVGDVIVEFNGAPIVDSADLPHEVGLTKAGETVPVKVVRAGKTKVLDVKVGSLEGGGKDAITSTGAGSANRLGASVRDLDEEQRAALRIVSGVVVERVQPNSAAARANLRPGDVVTLINNQPIGSVEVFESVVSDLPSRRAVPMRIVRNGRAGFIAIRIDD